ncbi:DUF1642 domain-containing protein [Ignavigranum ruoffiae]|nr:DUF1642 domain-containing protein [Ignavigranum ruoffiae]
MDKREVINKITEIINGLEEPFDWQTTEWEAVEEPEKAKIPKFVANWIKEVKFGGGTLREALDFIAQPDEVYGWVYANDYNKFEVLAKAWINGYEIEKEPLFYAKIKGSELTRDYYRRYWNYLPLEDRFIVLGNHHTDEYQTKFSKEQWNNLGINDTNADFEEVES